MSEVMKARRQVLGMSQARLADLVGVTTRQIARYEADEQQPVLSVAATIASALQVPLAELAGEESPHPDLKGVWWTGWEPLRATGGGPIGGATIDEAVIHQHLETVHLSAEGQPSAAPPGGEWRADLQLVDQRVLIGTYRGARATIETRGTLFLVLDAERTGASGRWVALGPGDTVATGWVSLARTAEGARQLLARLVQAPPPAPSGP